MIDHVASGEDDDSDDEARVGEPIGAQQVRREHSNRKRIGRPVGGVEGKREHAGDDRLLLVPPTRPERVDE